MIHLHDWQPHSSRHITLEYVIGKDDGVVKIEECQKCFKKRATFITPYRRRKMEIEWAMDLMAR